MHASMHGSAWKGTYLHGSWLQVNIGPTHNIFLSPYADYRPGSDQYDWFYNDLISIDRTLTPWVTL